MLSTIEKVKKVILYFVVVMMLGIVLISTFRMGWTIVVEFIKPPFLMLDSTQIFKVFGVFLVILIGVELLESCQGYLRDGEIRVAVVLEIALIAIGRKLIILDWKKVGDMTLFGIAALVLALAAGLFLIKRRRRTATAAHAEEG